MIQNKRRAHDVRHPPQARQRQDRRGGHLAAEIRKEQLDARSQTLRPGLTADVPAGNRLPHDQLIKIGASYYDGAGRQ